MQHKPHPYFLMHHIVKRYIMNCVIIGVRHVCLILIFIFFKQKTAYEMRISDWSSDVCSSDLANHAVRPAHVSVLAWAGVSDAGARTSAFSFRTTYSESVPGPGPPRERSEERRVGKECVSTCRSR